jgi:hypothetical protein
MVGAGVELVGLAPGALDEGAAVSRRNVLTFSFRAFSCSVRPAALRHWQVQRVLWFLSYTLLRVCEFTYISACPSLT